MEISKETYEFEVVKRLGRILCQPPDTDYEVTLSYSIFSTLLCWTLQKIRADRDTRNKFVANLEHSLKKDKIADHPWLVSSFKLSYIELQTKNYSRPRCTPDFGSVSAHDFLIALRNSVAHGDDRNIKSLHETDDVNITRLSGYIFDIKIKIRLNNDDWILVGSVELNREDMSRIGTELTRLFCNALRQAGAVRLSLTDSERAA